MNTALLFHQFNTAINWNAYYYLVHRSSYTLRTFLFYTVMTSEDFSTWATLNSTIFLILLWSDCGLRKSIPRYAPHFYNRPSHFKTSLIILQIVLLVITLPITYYCLSYLTTNPHLLILALILFIMEGIHHTLKLIHHSHFHNRSFNSIAMQSTMLNLFIIVTAITIGLHSHHLLLLSFFSQLITTGLMIMRTATTIPNPKIQPTITNESYHTVSFFTHSLVMWGTTLLKSLSERNFLVPFFTHMIGVPSGNLFKVANDSALLGYRLILKTIGSTDTALLAHTHIAGDTNSMSNAVKKLTTKVARLCLPVLGILVLLSFYNYRWFNSNQFVFHAFLIMSISYIIETTLLPYERVLEVKRNYTIIFLCYIPYVCMLVFLISGMLITSIGFMHTLIIIHGVRLVSCLLMRGAVYRIYGL